ncbi:hypothetical protein NLI96_g12149 [Meripilus lineatus]|uniref:Transposase domain-containing protein n=1 Tax=Meripilus lineatus TaxID=2056292 RepID=A0AAD5UQL8_9APHY|nr:hypothetical protein NLI96_g12149 [Physisporinus lineatus]
MSRSQHKQPYNDEDSNLLELHKLYDERIAAEAIRQATLDHLTSEPPTGSELVISSSSSQALTSARLPDIPMDDIPSDPSPPSPISIKALSGRGMRNKRPTWKILEQLPSPPVPIIDVPSSDSPDNLSTPSTSTPDPTLQHPFFVKVIETAANLFGVFRAYITFSTYDPDSTISLEDLSDLPVNPSLSPPLTAPHSLSTSISSDPHFLRNLSSTIGSPKPHPYEVAGQNDPKSYAPFSNWSIAGLMDWMWTGSHQKSIAELDQLVHNVLLDPRFDPSHLENFSTSRETAKLDRELAFEDDAWIECDVQVRVPDGRSHSKPTDPPIPTFTVPGLQRRSLVEVILTIWSDQTSKYFHFTPFKQLWKTAGDRIQRIHGELYTSDAFLQAHEELQQSPTEPNCTLERVVCAMMFWSDSTHLASFGNASLWPLYLFFGNQSKYTRCRPSSGACHHVAYIPKLPDTFYDFYVGITGKAPTPEMMAHMKRELFHSVWSLLLDDEFLYAYVHGIVVKCADGIHRRIYPRIFTYSADYPEKILIALIRNMGLCPCPRCKEKKTLVPEMGMERDNTRREKEARDSTNMSYQVRTDIASKLVSAHGKPLKNCYVEEILTEESLVPTKVAHTYSAIRVIQMIITWLQNAFTT